MNYVLKRIKNWNRVYAKRSHVTKLTNEMSETTKTTISDKPNLINIDDLYMSLPYWILRQFLMQHTIKKKDEGIFSKRKSVKCCSVSHNIVIVNAYAVSERSQPYFSWRCIWSAMRLFCLRFSGLPRCEQQIYIVHLPLHNVVALRHAPAVEKRIELHTESNFSDNERKQLWESCSGNATEKSENRFQCSSRDSPIRGTQQIRM